MLVTDFLDFLMTTEWVPLVPSEFDGEADPQGLSGAACTGLVLTSH